MTLQVTIVGAGIAGMSAALRLLERGFHVRLLEQDDFMGGMMRACTFPDETSGQRHEHSYHMVTNWYLNLWALVDDLGLRANFTPCEGLRFMRRGQPQHCDVLEDVGSAGSLLRNLCSGVAPAPDLFIFAYSMVDLLATPMHRGSLLDKYSVNGFMRSRPYATDRAAELHQRTWETVWALPSYHASAYSYQQFLKFGNYAPSPAMWLFRGNKYDALIGPLERRLRSFGARFEFLPWVYVNALTLDDHGRVAALKYNTLDYSPSIDMAGWHVSEVKIMSRPKTLDIDGDLILAVTPGAAARLVDGPLFQRDNRLGNLRKLHSEPMATVELRFKTGVFLPHVPSEVVVLVDANYQMTFLDYTQHWPGETSTLLYVTCSDCEALLCLPAERRVNATAEHPGELVVNLQQPSTAIEYLLVELHNTLAFDLNQVDWVRTRLQTNSGDELFANEVGSEDFRPGTTTHVPNLFLAGTYVSNYANVSTIEGAVTSGLLAAEAVRARAGVMPPIPIQAAGCHQPAVYTALKWAWAPYAYGAKLWSMANDAWAPPGGDVLAPWVNALHTLADAVAPRRPATPPTRPPGSRRPLPRP